MGSTIHLQLRHANIFPAQRNGDDIWCYRAHRFNKEYLRGSLTNLYKVESFKYKDYLLKNHTINSKISSTLWRIFFRDDRVRFPSMSQGSSRVRKSGTTLRDGSSFHHSENLGRKYRFNILKNPNIPLDADPTDICKPPKWKEFLQKVLFEGLQKSF